MCEQQRSPLSVVITTAARMWRVEHVGAERRRSVRACAAGLVAERLWRSRPVPGRPTLSAGSAGEPPRTSYVIAAVHMTYLQPTTHTTSLAKTLIVFNGKSRCR